MMAAAVFTQSTDNSNPSITQDMNITSITRDAEGIYTVTLDSVATSNYTLSSAIASVIGYGRSGDSPSQNPGDDEFTCNWGVKVNSSDIEIHSKDNNTDADRDFYRCYFMLFAR